MMVCNHQKPALVRIRAGEQKSGVCPQPSPAALQNADALAQASGGPWFPCANLFGGVLRLVAVCIIFCVISVHAAESKPAPVDSARSLIERLLAKQHKHFTVEMIDSAAGQDVFEIESRNGKIILRGNNGVAIASALNRYITDFCHCDISWNCSNHLNLPKLLPLVPNKIRIVSPHKFR